MVPIHLSIAIGSSYMTICTTNEFKGGKASVTLLLPFPNPRTKTYPYPSPSQ
jgi:hypothetical protein